MFNFIKMINFWFLYNYLCIVKKIYLKFELTDMFRKDLCTFMVLQYIGLDGGKGDVALRYFTLRLGIRSEAWGSLQAAQTIMVGGIRQKKSYSLNTIQINCKSHEWDKSMKMTTLSNLLVITTIDTLFRSSLSSMFIEFV